jgi:hypothetical protein
VRMKRRPSRECQRSAARASQRPFLVEAGPKVRIHPPPALQRGVQCELTFGTNPANRLWCLVRPRFRGDDRLTETADYCAAARIGMCAFKKRRTRSIVRCLSSSGSFHG